MKPNINKLADFGEVTKVLLDKGVSRATVETLKAAITSGMVIKKAGDLNLLSIPLPEVTLIGGEVTFGASQPEPQDFKTVQYTFEPVGQGNVEAHFFGYQFDLTYTNKQHFTVEESFPIEDHRVIVDIDLNDVLDNSKITYQIRDPRGEHVKAAFSAGNTAPGLDPLAVTKSTLANTEITVEVIIPDPFKNPLAAESYRVTGKVISKSADTKMDGFQVVILASVGNLPDGTPEFFPVAYAMTESFGYFLTSVLVFPVAEDVIRVKQAMALVARDDFKAELPIRLVTSTEGAGETAVHKSMIPPRLILVIDEKSQPQDKPGDCGCNDLNFHEKKVFEEFTYHSVVRTTEPSVIADVIEEEDEIDLGDIYGDPWRGKTVPISVFQKFYEIKTRQISPVNFDFARAVSAGVDAPPAGVLMRSAAALSTESAVMTTGVRPLFADYDAQLLDRLVVDHRARQTAQGKRPRVHKGRAHLDPLNQINWDKATIYQAASIAHGHLLHFKQEWIPDGYSIADLLYSMPLAPGQKKQIAVLDWERRESAARSQALDYEESLNNLLVRDRDISEVIRGTISESMEGTSTAKTSGFAAGLGGAAMGIIKGVSFGALFGISGGSSKSGSTASQNSNRSSTANSLQALRDRTMQSASSVRSQRATVVQTVSQGERVEATSESVANYNHCHAITIQYFEVVRHFQVRNRFVGAQECLFIPLQITTFDLEKALRWRNTIERRLLKRGLLNSFDALERIKNERESPTENYYDSIGYPRKNFAEQSIVSFDGELFVEFYFFNTKDSIDDGIIEFFKKFFHVDLADYKDRKLTDNELSKIVGPRTIEKLLDALVIETEAGTRLNIDVTLISPFRQNSRLQMSIRQSGPVSIPRVSINGIKIRLDKERVRADDTTDITQFTDKYMKILLRSGSFRYRTNNFAGTLFNTRIDNDLFVGADAVFIPTPLTNDELRNPRGEDVDAANNLIHHLNENLEFYHKCLWFDMADERRYMLLDGIVAPGKANGRSVASVVENTIIGVAGNSLIMPVAPGNQLDPTIDDTFDLFAQYHEEDGEPMRISLPTKGVYAEAVIGQCNSCEEKDESRFWRWEESPVPDSPTTQINPINTDTRRAEPGSLEPKDFANPMVNIQNAPNAPDPTGLQAVMQLLGRSDLFRDLTGLTENQRNALATFQASLQSAQAFGKEASDLAKTAGMIDLIKNAQKSGTISNDEAKNKAGQAIEQGLDPKDPNAERLSKGLGLLDKFEKDGVIAPDVASKAKSDLLRNFLDSSGAKTPMSNDEISGLVGTAAQNNADVAVTRPDGEKVDVKASSGLAIGDVVESENTNSTSANVQLKIARKRQFLTSDSTTRSSRTPRIDKVVYTYEITNNEIEPVDFFMEERVKVHLTREGTDQLLAHTFTRILQPGQTVRPRLEFTLDPDNETIKEYLTAPQINRDFRGDPNASISPAGTLFTFPFPKNMAVRCDQAFNPQPSATNPHPTHTGIDAFAVDFNLAMGTDLFAARGGTVVEVIDRHPDHTDNPHTPVEADKGVDNEIRVMHADGTYATYGHIKQSSAKVRAGDKVQEGTTLLAQSGHNGFSTGPHLHFKVSRADGTGKFQSLVFAFKDANGAAVTPEEGKTYTRT